MKEIPVSEAQVDEILRRAKENGEYIILSFVVGVDPYDGDRVKVKEKWIAWNQKKGRWEFCRISCYDSAHLGLGTCLCESHNIYDVDELSEQQVIEILLKKGGKVTLF
jgi:hypothetical protein